MRRLLVGVGAAFLLLSATALASGDTRPVPWSRIGTNMLGDSVATGAVRSGVPVLIVAGVTYKAADLAHDLGDAAVMHENRWLGAELIRVDEDTRRLKAIEEHGGDLDGSEAQAIKERLRNTAFEMTIDQRSPAGYLLRVSIKNLPYAVRKVALDQLLKQFVGASLHLLHIDELIETLFPVPQKINWMINYGGPLQNFEKGLGWGLLGTRARAAERVARNVMRDQENAAVVAMLGRNRTESLERSASTVLSRLYRRAMAEHPSKPRVIVFESSRLEAARAAVSVPLAVAASVPVAAVAAPIEAVAAPIEAPIPARTAPDPVVTAIRRDDAVIPHPHAHRRSEARTSERSHLDLCADGCPALDFSSWD